MDLQLIVGTAAFACVPVGFVLRKVHDTAEALAAHKAEDAATFRAISETLADLKSGQTHVNDKLDRLVERFL